MAVYFAAGQLAPENKNGEGIAPTARKSAERGLLDLQINSGSLAIALFFEIIGNLLAFFQFGQT